MSDKKSPKIKVSYYDDKHKKLLEKTPKADNIKKLIEDGNFVNQDFWTYFMFVDKDNFEGFNQYSDMAKLWKDYNNYTGKYLDVSNETIRAKFPSEKLKGTQFSERIGVAGGLSAIGTIHGLTEADWDVIPVSKNADLDFRIASDSDQIIEVECKGTFVDDNVKTQSMRNHRDSILKKKDKQKSLGNKNILYGAITTYSNKPNLMGHTYLLDPPSDRLYDDPYKLRVMSRLSFYHREIRKISNLHLLISLANRINTLSSWEVEAGFFDNIQLVNIKGEKCKFPSSLSTNRSIIDSKDNPGFGEIYEYKEKEYFFFGFSEAIINLLIEQDYSKLTDYRSEEQEFYAQVDAKVIKGKSSKRFPIKLSGYLQKNSAGRILGLLKPV